MNVVGKLVRAAVVLAACTQQIPGFAQSAAPSANAAPVTAIPINSDLAFIETPEFLPGNLARRFPRGSRLVRLNAADGTVIALTPTLFAAADPQVSFDGRTILFAAQAQQNEPWQIWEIAADGARPRQITHCQDGCVKPVYLPENQLAYTSLRGARNSEVEVASGDGSAAHPITFGPGGFETETVRDSGRLLLSAESPLLDAPAPESQRSLYLINPDGSGLTLLRQETNAAILSSDATELPDGTIVFLRRGSRSSDGRLAWIRPGVMASVTLPYSLSGYASVQMLDAGTLAVSRHVGQRFDLYQLSLHGTHRETLFYGGANVSSVQAVPIVPRPTVQAYRSILHPDRTTGRLICLNAYASKDLLNDRVPGKIARVRAVMRTKDGEKSLGEAPVEQDGSFYASVPADVPVRLMLVGAHGEILKQQRSWMWVRRGEDRGCIGCHESQALTPDNRSPLALQRFDTPTPLLGQDRSIAGWQKAVQP